MIWAEAACEDGSEAQGNGDGKAARGVLREAEKGQAVRYEEATAATVGRRRRRKKKTMQRDR